MYAADEVLRVIGDCVAGPVNMAPGSVVSSYVDGGARVVTFASGAVARERLIARDEAARRIVYSLIGDTVRPEHDNAASSNGSASEPSPSGREPERAADAQLVVDGSGDLHANVVMLEC